MLKMDGVSKRLGSFSLKDISFEIPAGYICGLVGQNGAGKTTLLHLLLGLYQPDGGTVSIDGLTYAEQEKEIRNQTGTVLAEELFEPHFNLMDNADYYGAYFSGYSGEEMREYLSRFGLDGKRKFGKLSKGEKLKCQFAFALSCQPSLLILDEPVANFDPDFREQFFSMIRDFISDGKRSVVLATHLTEDLDRLADYLIYLEEGRQLFAGDMETFRSKYRLVTGESYKIKLLPKDRIIAVEEKTYGARALVEHSRLNQYDKSLTVTYPRIEDVMYFLSKRKKKDEKQRDYKRLF